MHEFSLCQGIIKQVAKANHERLDNVAEVSIEVGKLAGVDVESLQFWFPVVAEKMNCTMLKLNLEQVDGLARCNQCTTSFNLLNLYDPCPNCGAFSDYVIEHGRELLVKSFSLNS